MYIAIINQAINQQNYKHLIAEFTWNHTTLHTRNSDPSITYLQSIFPDDDLQTIEHMYHHFGDEVMMHLEFIRANGAVGNPGLQLVGYSTEEPLHELSPITNKEGYLLPIPSPI